jgi:hypothetical protein
MKNVIVLMLSFILTTGIIEGCDKTSCDCMSELNLSELQQTDKVTVNGECSECENKTIIGKWKLVKTASGRTGKGNIMHTDSTAGIIFEFKPDNILTVQCLRQDNNCMPYRNGDYSYQFRVYGNSWYEKKIEIGNSSWWYRISETELELTQGPVDGGGSFFERINDYEQYDCSKCNDTTVIAVLEDEPAYIKEKCYNVFGREYSFAIILAITKELIYPCGGIPEEFQVEGLPVLINGNTLNCRHIVVCKMLPNAKYAPSNLFELRTIKINGK